MQEKKRHYIYIYIYAQTYKTFLYSFLFNEEITVMLYLSMYNISCINVTLLLRFDYTYISKKYDGNLSIL